MEGYCMQRGPALLSRGLFEKEFMDSRIKTQTVSKKEKILGHLVGPLGLIFVVNTIGALVEKFFTQQVGAVYGTGNLDMVRQMGGRYEVVMTVAKILAVGLGLLIGWLIQHTQSRQGRFRPWYLIFGFMSIAIGCLIFLFAGENGLGDSYWYYFFFLIICYNTVGCTFFYLFRDNICSLTTRNTVEKTQIQFIRKMSWTLISGIIIGMLVSMVVLPMWLEKDITGYPKIMLVLSIVAIPLMMLEYYYTRERISEDVSAEAETDNLASANLIAQVKALLSNKYFVIMFVLTTIGMIVDNFKGGNVQYFYIKFMLGGADNPLMYTIYQVATGVPLGVGAIITYPLAKKFGIRNITFAGYVFVLIGSVLGWLFPTNMVTALIAGFLRQMGMIPNAYITATLLCFAYDSVEYRSHIRPEGLIGISVLTALQSAVCAPFAGGYESSILKLGFVDAVNVSPDNNVTSFMTLAFYLFDIILAAAYIILLPLVDVEKKMPEINTELIRRRKEAAIARGEEWIDPDELERMEKERSEAEYEAARVNELKIKCEKKGLDFEAENAKYLAKKNKRKK